MNKLIAILTISLAFSVPSFGQFSGPYRIAYNTTNGTFLVSNKDGGSIAELNSSFQPKNVITGLYAPTDIEIASFGTNTGLLVLDDKKVKLFSSSTYASILDFAVPGASELIDLAIDPKNAGDFYITDRGNNAIIKGVVGPPPFYTPSFTTLVDTGLSKPSALMFDRQGNLLVALDTANSSIYSVNTTNGSLTHLYSTGLDSINAMAQDGQGNLFVTNWGDSKQYRIDSGYTKITEIVSLNKPAGMFVDASRNLLITACYKCNKLEFKSLHLLIPQSDIYMCATDSATVRWDIRYTGVSTWGSNNEFILEISDSSGSFSSPTSVLRTRSKERPSEMKFALPRMVLGSQHKYRVRSTVPGYTGSEKTINFYQTPKLKAAESDTIIGCINTNLTLGSPAEANTSYTWTSHTNLSSNSISQPTYSPKTSDTIQLNVWAENTMTGCKSEDSVVIISSENAQLLGLVREKETCKGVSLGIGVEAAHYTYSWTPKLGLDDSEAATPTYMDTVSRKYFVTLTDTLSSCVGVDSVNVIVRPLPLLKFSDTVHYCEYDLLQIQHATDTNYTYSWNPKTSFENAQTAYPILRNFPSPAERFNVRVSNTHGCIDSSELFAYGTKNELKANVMWINADSIQVVYFFSGSQMTSSDVKTASIQRFNQSQQEWEDVKMASPDETDTLAVDQSDSLRLMYETSTGCTYMSEVSMPSYISAQEILKPEWHILENPVTSHIEIAKTHPELECELISPSGQNVLRKTLNPQDQTIDIHFLPNGVYWLTLTAANGKTHSIRLVKVSR